MRLTVKILRKGYSKRIILKHIISCIEVKPRVFEFTDIYGNVTWADMQLCDECFGFVE